MDVCICCIQFWELGRRLSSNGHIKEYIQVKRPITKDYLVIALRIVCSCIVLLAFSVFIIDQNCTVLYFHVSLEITSMLYSIDKSDSTVLWYTKFYFKKFDIHWHPDLMQDFCLNLS